MMLALLIYCYANGIFGSSRIERATYRDLAVRYLCADAHPDHDTICKFRRENFEAVSEAFLEILLLARELKLLKVGTISVDGTKVDANASKHRNVRYDRAGELVEQLKVEIAELLERAEAADGQETEEGQRLPEAPRRPRWRVSGPSMSASSRPGRSVWGSARGRSRSRRMRRCLGTGRSISRTRIRR